MKPSVRMQGVAGASAALVAMITAGCTAQGISRSALDTLESDKQALQQQLAAMAPTVVVQAGQLAPPPPAVKPTGWDTPESVRGRLKLLATYDSSGPNAWDPIYSCRPSTDGS